MTYFKAKKNLILLPIFWILLAIFAYSTHASSANKSAIVLLIPKDSTGEILGTGTGFIVKPEGILVTNYHVLVDATAIEAVMFNGDKIQIKSICNTKNCTWFKTI